MLGFASVPYKCTGAALLHDSGNVGQLEASSIGDPGLNLEGLATALLG